MTKDNPKKDAFLGDASIRELIAARAVIMSNPQVEPASIDVPTIGRHHLVPVSFLPDPDRSIGETIRSLQIASVRGSTRIMPNAPYVTIVPLDLDLDLPPDVKAVFSPKSSIGRIDLNVRVMADRHGRYDETPYGYKGKLWAEMRSSSFPIVVNQWDEGVGEPLTQVRFVKATNPSGGASTLLRTQVLSIAVPEDGSPGWTSDLRDPTSCIEVGRSKDLPVADFWRPIPRIGNAMVLRKGAFYIMRSKEALQVAADECSVLRQVEPSLSMCSSHMAGFADPGFGSNGSGDSHLVFEIRNPENDMLVRDGQPIGVMETHRLDRPATRLYGTGRESYQGQTVRLSRCFATT